MDEMGEALEHGVKRIGKRMHRYGEKPSLDSVAIQGDWKKPADIYNTVNDRLTAAVDVFEKFYTQMLKDEDSDSAHLIKDILHELKQNHINWLERQFDHIGAPLIPTLDRITAC